MAASVRLIFCVDAGATRSRGRFYDEAGVILASGEAGPANPSYALDQALASLDTLWRSLATTVGRQPETVSDIDCVIGGAGLYVPKATEAFKVRLPPFRKTILMSDGYAALVGASGGKPAALLTIGTGVAGHRLFEDGTSIQRDALGWVVGDRGGGAWMGTRAVRHALEVWDGIAPPSALSLAILARIGGAEGVLGGALSGLTATRLAAFAPVLLQQAKQGCAVASGIFETAVDYLARLVLALKCSDIPLYLNGGLAKVFRSRLEDRLRRSIAEPEGDALHGCLLVALGLAPAERMTFGPAEPIGESS